MVKARYFYPCTLRLLKSKEFNKVFSNTQFKANHGGVLFLAKMNNLGHPRLGFVISKRTINLAVNRNRVKRVVRDFFRLRQHEFPPLDVVIIARRPLADMDNNMVRKVTKQLSSKLERQYENKKGVRQS